MVNLTELQDPRTQYATPPMPDQKQELPGVEAMILPKADHGEESYKGSGKLAGRVALITGGDSGIGKAVAIAYAREGADVAISYQGIGNEEQDAQDTARLIREAGQRALTLPGDIADPQQCKNIVGRTIAELGKIDILVNNAAMQHPRMSMLEIPADELEYTFKTNYFAQIYITQAALPKMKPGAAIINTTSIEAYQPDAMLTAYASTKAAIANFTKSLAKEAIKSGIRVNAVAPGPIWTPLVVATMPPDQLKTFGQDTLIGRPGQPVELSPVYVLLASAEASYITGQIYGITGGDPIG